MARLRPPLQVYDRQPRAASRRTFRPVRASVLGCSGAGKTTFGKRLAARLGCPFVELDAIVHQPGWTRLPRDAFRARVEAALACDAWVCDGNYREVHDLVRDRATDVVWLDPPKALVMAQVIWRSAVRAITREELWNGNRERASEWLNADHPIRWAWSNFEYKRRRYGAAMRSPDYAHVRFHHLKDRRAVSAFLDAASRATESPPAAASAPPRSAESRGPSGR
jgi:adenylate kinase family enzyme